MGRERREGHQVGRGAGVDQEAVLHPEERGQFLFEGFALGSEREPEIQGRADGGFDLVLVKYAAGVGNGLAGRPRRVGGVIAGALALVHESGVIAGEFQDLRFEFGGR